MVQDLSHNNEYQLWDAFRHGEPGSLELLYRQYYIILFRYGYRFIGDHAQLEDTLQDFFLYLIDHRYNLGKTNSIRFYLIKSFRRFLFRKIKSIDRNKVSPLAENLHFTLEFTPGPFVDEREDQKEKKEKLREALRRLTRQQREAVYLKFFVGLDYREIAEVMEIKYQSSRTLIYLSLKALREVLAGHEK